MRKGNKALLIKESATGQGQRMRERRVCGDGLEGGSGCWRVEMQVVRVGAAKDLRAQDSSHSVLSPGVIEE